MFEGGLLLLTLYVVFDEIVIISDDQLKMINYDQLKSLEVL